MLKVFQLYPYVKSVNTQIPCGKYGKFKLNNLTIKTLTESKFYVKYRNNLTDFKNFIKKLQDGSLFNVRIKLTESFNS